MRRDSTAIRTVVIRAVSIRSVAWLLAGGLLWTGCGGPAPTSDDSPPAASPAPASAGMSAEAGPGPWQQWRGATGMGLTSETGLPEVWSAESSNLRWRSDVRGDGNSSPIVDRGRVYVTTSFKDEAAGQGIHRACLAYDYESGDKLWETIVLTSPAEARHRMNTSAAPTPVTDGEHVFVYFGSHIAALGLDGAIVWKKEIDPEYHEYSRYAASSSPILVDDLLMIAQDQERADTDELGWFAAYDKGTGEEVWRQEWDDTCCSYSTPLVMWQEGERRMLFAHSGIVAEYDPRTGEKLWTHTLEINQMVSSIVAENDVLCIAGGAHNVRLSSCVRLAGQRQNTTVEVLWESVQGPPETSSPVLYEGKLYVVTSKGILTCFDAVTGEKLWRRRLEHGGYHVSLLAGDGKVYVPNARGLVTVIDVSGEHGRIVAQNQLDRGGNASPAVAGGSILVRTRDQLIRIDKESAADRQAAAAAAETQPADD